MCLQCWFYTKKILKLYKGARHRPNAHPKPDWCSPAARFLILIPVSTSTHRYNYIHVYTHIHRQVNNYRGPIREIADKIREGGRFDIICQRSSIGGGVSIFLSIARIQFNENQFLEKDRVQGAKMNRIEIRSESSYSTLIRNIKSGYFPFHFLFFPVYFWSTLASGTTFKKKIK